jgi:hypothetical protein
VLPQPGQDAHVRQQPEGAQAHQDASRPGDALLAQLERRRGNLTQTVVTDGQEERQQQIGEEAAAPGGKGRHDPDHPHEHGIDAQVFGDAAADAADDLVAWAAVKHAPRGESLLAVLL